MSWSIAQTLSKRKTQMKWYLESDEDWFWRKTILFCTDIILKYFETQWLKKTRLKRKQTEENFANEMTLQILPTDTAQ